MKDPIQEYVDKIVDKQQTKYPRKWERICDYTFRLKTPTGWVINTYTCNESSEALCFVPDLGHTWILEEEES